MSTSGFAKSLDIEMRRSFRLICCTGPCSTMNMPSAPESTIRYYTNRESIGYWGAIAAGVGVISGGASLAAHSFRLTACLLLGVVAVWYLGYWALSKSCYFISSTNAGFKDLFRTREVQFEEVRSVTKSTGQYSSTLVFECATRTVTMPLDPLDETWFSAVKVELHKRGIEISSSAFGFKLKGEQGRDC